MCLADAGGCRSAIGIAAFGLMTVPWCAAGRKPGEKLPVALYGRPRGSGSTTNVGRLSVRLPRAVGDPRPQAGKAGQQEAGVLHVAGRAVDVGLRGHRHQEGQVVDALGHVRKHAADPAAALAVLLELERRLHDRADFAGGRRLDAEVDLLAVPLASSGL